MLFLLGVCLDKNRVKSSGLCKKHCAMLFLLFCFLFLVTETGISSGLWIKYRYMSVCDFVCSLAVKKVSNWDVNDPWEF